MKYIDDLISSGSDSFSNLFDVKLNFQKDGSSEDITTSISNCRIVRTDNIPAAEQSAVNFTYKGVTFYKTAPGITLDRKFNLVFRIDENYIAFKILKSLQFLTTDSASGPMKYDSASKVVISLYKISSDNSFTSFEENNVLTITFSGVTITKVATTAALSYEGSEPQKAQVTFTYINYNYS